jgi:putative inorganic carbon (HCO3(-)) transporter
MKNVKQNLFWLWHNLEKILIIVFFLTFTINIRKVILTPCSSLKGSFSEYTTIFISWADVLMVSTIIIYVIKVLYRQLNSNGKWIRLDRNLTAIASIKVSRETYYLIILLIWSSLSIFWSISKAIAAYRVISLIEICVFVYIALAILREKKWLNLAIYALITNGVAQSIIGIIQFATNKSIGLRIFGESIIGPYVDGVAKIVIEGEKHIRAYGTFPHPNIMGGFLIVPIAIVFVELSIRLRLRFQAYEKEVSYETTLRMMSTRWLALIEIILIIGLLLTYSRSAFLGLVVGLCIICLIYKNFDGRIITQMKRKGLIIAITVAIILFVLILGINTNILSGQSMSERSLYQEVSYETISEHPLAGVGMGQFVINEYIANPNFQNWQYQPVHNVYLLIFSELGVIGFMLIIFILIMFLHRLTEYMQNGKNLTMNIYYIIIISYAVIAFFDHYFWDIKVGMLIFVSPIIILRAMNKLLSKK